MSSFWKGIGLTAALISLPGIAFSQHPYGNRPGCATMQPLPPSVSPPWVEPDPMTPDTGMPPAPMTPDAITPPAPMTADPFTPSIPMTADTSLSFSTAQTGIGSPDVAFAAPGGYIDNPIPRTRLTLRFDAGYDNPRPDRAEFFYARSGALPNGPGPRPNTPPGGPRAESDLDYQELWLNLESAFLNERASAFVELPFRFIDPELSENESGLGDINFGLKYALIADPDQILTMQLRVYSPTGDEEEGLGTDHYSIEPGLLYLRRLNQDWSLFGELRDWIPIDGSDDPVVPGGSRQEFDGNVLRYGVGLAYDLIDNPCQGYRVSPVFELVGWHVFDGLATTSIPGVPGSLAVQDARSSIVNSKIGVRFTFADSPSSNFAGFGGDQSLYLGWGHGLTNHDDVWYDDILRAEYRLNF